MSKKIKMSKEQKQILAIHRNLVNYVLINFLFNIYGILLKSGVCPETKKGEWLKTISEMHVRGMLYYGNEDGQVKVVVGAWKIKEFNEKVIDMIPEKEEGNILYVSFMASMAQDKTLPRKLLNNYLQNHQEVDEVVFYERNSDTKFKRLKVNRKKEEKPDVEIKGSESSNVPEKPIRGPESVTVNNTGTKS